MLLDEPTRYWRRLRRPGVGLKLMMQPELTNHCNFRCRFCPHSVYGRPSPAGNRFDRPKGYMSRTLFEVFLENAARHARSVVVGFFGEPMLHPEFESLVRMFPSRRPYRLILNSNWSLARRANMDTLRWFDLVRISLDASRPDLYETLCPGGPVLSLDGVPSDDRHATLEEKVRHWLDLPFHPHTLLIYVVSSINKDDQVPFLRKWLPRMDPADGVATKSVISYGGAMADEHMRAHPCRVPTEDRLTVAWNGDCSPCNLDVNMALRVGNLLETPDVAAIVKGTQYQRVLRSVRRREGVCANCFDANNHTESVVLPGRRKDAEKAARSRPAVEAAGGGGKPC
jgi:pyruvate-formate lyase-activating enzyme